jgi:hypothetical protein
MSYLISPHWSSTLYWAHDAVPFLGGQWTVSESAFGARRLPHPLAGASTPASLSA